MHNVGTVPMFKIHNLGDVPTFKMHNIGTLEEKRPVTERILFDVSEAMQNLQHMEALLSSSA